MVFLYASTGIEINNLCLSQWPPLGEGVESASQGYTGGLPLGSHPGQQPLQMEHMVSVLN